MGGPLSAGPIIERLQIAAASGDLAPPLRADPLAAPNQNIQGDPMRKTYALNIEGKNRDRLLEAAKHDIRKYVKRERARALPEGVDFWDFDCKFGNSEADAAVVHFATITDLIDAVANDGGEQFYVEVVTKHGHRTFRPRDENENAAVENDLDSE